MKNVMSIKDMKVYIPNLITFINLSLGLIAILIVVNNQSVKTLFYSCVLVCGAVLADRFDGQVARKLGATSELGKQLDSLSDLISFGVAPVAVAWQISLVDLGIIGYVIAIFFSIAGAYRLARYNVSTMNDTYTGMPITAAAAILTLLNLFNCWLLANGNYKAWNTVPTVIFVIVLSVLMVSKIKVKKI